jgi:hypothetical protein
VVLAAAIGCVKPCTMADGEPSLRYSSTRSRKSKASGPAHAAVISSQTLRTDMRERGNNPDAYELAISPERFASDRTAQLNMKDTARQAFWGRNPQTLNAAGFPLSRRAVRGDYCCNDY